MTHYIDAEKLSVQIEKLFPDSSDERIVEGFEYALDKVKAIINSLQQGRSDVGFDDEFAKFNIGMYNPFNSRAEIHDFARHFYELGLNTRKDESDI